MEITATAAAAGVPGRQLRTWVDRRALRLDADEQRDRIGAKRQFTVADAFRIAFVAELSGHGVPLITAGQIVEEAVNFPLMAEDPTTPDKIAATFAENVMVVWRDKNGRWLWAIEPYAQVNVSTVTRVDLFAVASGVAGRLRSAKMQEEGAAVLA